VLMVGVIPRWIYKAAVRTLQLVLAAALFPVLRGCYLRVRHFGMTALASFGIRIEPSRRNTVPGLSPKSTVVRGRNQATRRPTLAATTGSQGADGPSQLFVLIHGLGGTPDDLRCLERNLTQRGGTDVLVHKPACNTLVRSFDGVPNGARRVADEIRAVVAEHRASLRRISLVGNSLGGIYARYAAALLFDEDSKTIAGLEPTTFLTTASPHLGVGPFGYLGMFPSPLQTVGAALIGESCSQLMLRDGRGNQRPLLAKMADPMNGKEGARGSGGGSGARDEADGLPFVDALASFERRCAYANAVNDFLVAFETASIDPDATRTMRKKRSREASNPASANIIDAGGFGAAAGPTGSFPFPFTGAPRIADERDHIPTDPASHERSLSGSGSDAGDGLALQRKMAAGLQTLSWHHVDVEFPGYLPLAHNKICALQRDPVMEFLFKDGEFIVEHQAEYLLTWVREQ